MATVNIGLAGLSIGSGLALGGPNSTTLSVSVSDSVTFGGAGNGSVQLAGDVPLPAPNYYYGTNGGGSRGFFPLSQANFSGVSLLNGFTGTVSIVGSGLTTVTTNMGTETIVVSGAIDPIIYSNLTATGQTLGQNISATGNALYSDIIGLSGFISMHNVGVVSLNGLSGVLSLTSSGFVTFQTGVNTITLGVTGLATSTSLTTSGQTLYNDIVGLSGQAVASYSTISSLYTSGSNLYMLVTGTSGQANINYATTVNLGLTGSTLYKDIIGLSGLLIASVGGVASLNGLSGILSLQSSGYLTTQTGVGSITFGITGLATCVNVTTTGQSLYGDIVGLSGLSFSTFSTIANLYVSGSNLYNDIVGLSGWANTNLATLAGLTTSGQILYNDVLFSSGTSAQSLTVSGAILYNDIIGLSGLSTITYATISSLISTGALLTSTILALSGYTNQFLVHTTGNENVNGIKTFSNTQIFSGGTLATNYFMTVSGLSGTPAQVILDFNGPALQSIVITGAMSFTGTNYQPGHAMTVRFVPSSSGYALSFSSGWAFLGSLAPTGTVAGKMGLLSLQCFDFTDTGVIAAYAAQP